MALSGGERDRLARLADPGRVHRELAADSREQLRAAMYDAHQGGATERDIAAATGLSKSAVHRHLVLEAEARQLLQVAGDGEAQATG
jgi:DNA-binding transcriptional regulator LsrR (DeoR family)